MYAQRPPDDVDEWKRNMTFPVTKTITNMQQKLMCGWSFIAERCLRCFFFVVGVVAREHGTINGSQQQH